jgi:Zn-finger nucleic acid-binding protein
MARPCPECQTALEPFEFDERVSVDRCGTCAGIWFEFAKAKAVAATTLPFEWLGAGVTTRRCPDCTVTLDTVLLPGAVPVEVCTICCGFWLDRADLRDLGTRVPAPDHEFTPLGFTCAWCHQQRPYSEANGTARGLVCTRCTPQIAAMPRGLSFGDSDGELDSALVALMGLVITDFS